MMGRGADEDPSTFAPLDPSLVGDGFVQRGRALEADVQLDYDDQGRTKAFALYGQLDREAALLDVAAAFQVAAREGAGAGVLGFCFGGLMAWLSATRGKDAGFTPACTVGYYAGGIGSVAQEDPLCPVLLHFGADDTHIGADQIEAVRLDRPVGLLADPVVDDRAVRAGTRDGVE